jgi:hypothetical protein
VHTPENIIFGVRIELDGLKLNYEEVISLGYFIGIRCYFIHFLPKRGVLLLL